MDDRHPPDVSLFPYPVVTSIVVSVIATTILLIIAKRFDPTAGPLTVSLLVILAFIGTTVFCLFFTVPNDEVTAGVVGGLGTAFGAVVAFWLANRK